MGRPPSIVEGERVANMQKDEIRLGGHCAGAPPGYGQEEPAAAGPPIEEPEGARLERELAEARALIQGPTRRVMGEGVRRGGRGGRRPEPTSGKPKVSERGPVVQRVKDGAVVFELRYTKCGKASCGTCQKGVGRWDSERPGHGPYWYRVFKVGEKTVRRYIGKSLQKLAVGDAVRAQVEEACSNLPEIEHPL